jgi:hypothetical protein
LKSSAASAEQSDFVVSSVSPIIEVKRMVARIVHFGLDSCFRGALLKAAGHSVEECNSVSQLHAALIGVREADAVVFSEGEGEVPYDAISLTRSTSTAPLILFRSRSPHYDESEFDLVIPEFTDPNKWLKEIAALIAGRRQQADLHHPKSAAEIPHTKRNGSQVRVSRP